MPRAITHRYRDPLDEVWLGLARRIGIRVERSDAVFASFDGAGTLTLGTPETLDADDSLAQIIFHELCHALVAGERGAHAIDWGMRCEDNAGDLHMEHACHRLQAALAQRHGLRGLMAVTTDHRAYWDALPDDPLADGDDPAIAIARDGMLRAEQGPWARALGDALRATAAIAEATAPFCDDGSLWRSCASKR